MRLDNLVTANKKSKISEGLRIGDLENLVSPKISIDEFEAKSGSENEVLVVAFYVKDDQPAMDLATFIERGSNKVIDTEVSPAPDDDGHYLVFVEINKDETAMPTVLKILKDLKQLVDVDVWEFNFYKNGTVEIAKEIL